MSARRVLAAAILGLAVIAPASGRAQDPGEEGSEGEEPTGDASSARSRARALANEGLRAYKRGDYVTALARFEAAEGIVPAPTIALHRARCLEKLGRLAEALERFTAVAGLPVAPDAPYVHHRARQDAQMEMQALDPRVPTVTIVVDGVIGGEAELVVDGRSSQFDGATSRVATRRIDPGQHTIELRRRDGSRATGTVDLRERQQTEVRLVLPPPRPGAAAAEETAPPASESGDGVAWSGDEQRTAGWVTLTAAGVGLGIALVSGAAAIAVGSDLDARCPDGVCPGDASGDVDRHDGLRAASTVGWIFAGALGAAGTLLLITAPDDGPSASASVGPRGVALRVDY